MVDRAKNYTQENNGFFFPLDTFKLEKFDCHTINLQIIKFKPKLN